jgi:hypothetical protein
MTEQSVAELLSSYNKTFLEVHGYKAPFIPSPVSYEWLADQLHALQWYARYENSLMTSRADEAEKRQPQEPSKKKVKKANPFS